MEKLVGVTEARTEFKSIVDQVQHKGDTYIIQRHGKPAAAVVPVEVYEIWKKERSSFFEFIYESQQQADLDPEEAQRIALEAVAAVRAKTA
jgi:prevent-host-death family protein